jgi:hypothetical protein
LKRGRFAAEDLMDEAATSIKQHPLQTVGLTFGLAFGVGALSGRIRVHIRPCQISEITQTEEAVSLSPPPIPDQSNPTA